MVSPLERFTLDTITVILFILTDMLESYPIENAMSREAQRSGPSARH